MKMQDILNEINKIISDPKVISVEIKDWKECGEFSGEDPRPILKIKKIKSKTVRIINE